jgi:hypothetical protein
MTQAQKIARENFKKAIAYRKKTGSSLKEAFAYVKKNKVTGTHKDTKSHNVNIRVVSGTKKKVGALPISFSGKILDIPFKVFHQYDIYNNVSSIVEDTNTGATISIIDGKGNVDTKADAFASYILKNSKYNKNELAPNFNIRIKKFVTDLTKEVKGFNSGKFETIKKVPVEIKPKKSTMPKAKTKKAATNKATPVKRKSATTKKAAKQTGTSNRIYDVLIQAKKPGKRVSKSGKTYYESRANRSDKGVLLGVNGIGKIGNAMINELKIAHDKLIKWQKILLALYIEKAKVSKGMKPVVEMDIKRIKDAIKEKKIHIQQLKKNIK